MAPKKKAVPKASTATAAATDKKSSTPASSPARGKASASAPPAKPPAATSTRASRSATTTTAVSAAPESLPPTRASTRRGAKDKEEPVAAAKPAPAAKKQKVDEKKKEPKGKKSSKSEILEVEEETKTEDESQPAPPSSPTIASPPRMNQQQPQAPLLYPMMGSPGIPQGGSGPGPQSGIEFTDQDILLPTTNEQIAARPANREYIQLLQANCAMFHSLPSNEQAWLLNNVCHFLTAIRKRRMLHYHPYYGWRVLTEPLPFIMAELNLDTFKRAAFRFHPLWLLGDHDPSGYHKGTPFIHRKVTGHWKRASVDDVRTILQGEGLKNLLLLPTGMDFDDSEDQSDGKTEEGDAVEATSV